MKAQTLGSINIERPALITANQENLPIPANIIKKNDYEIGEEQRLAANLALEAFQNNKKGFLLADGTGVGKTREILVVADMYQKLFKRKVLIVTENEQIIKGSFTSDALALGINLNIFELATYRNITPTIKYKEVIVGYKTEKVIDKQNSKPAKNGLNNYGLIIFDEAHNLKNDSSGKTIAALNIKRKHTLYATATPMDTITGLIYFVKEVTNFTEEQILKELGLTITEQITADGRIRRFIKLDNLDKNDKDYDAKNAIKQEQVKRNIIKLRNSLVNDGVMIRREYPFFGKITEIALPLNDIQKQEESQIDDFYQNKIDNLLSSGDFSGNLREQLFRIGGERSNELSRWNETQKINYVLEQVLKDYNAGKNVIVVAEGVNKTYFKGLDVEKEQFLGLLAKKLTQKGIDFAQVFGAGNKSREVERFQNEKVKILLATPQSGGTGINLDDTKGCCPRSMYVVTANYSGNVFQQILGRVSRRNTKTPAEVFLIYTDSISDMKRRQIVGKKIAILLAIQNGSQDVDTFAINESIEENEKQTENIEKNKENEKEKQNKIIENLPFLEDISEKAFVVKNSIAIKNELKNLGGKYLPKYSGWIFPNSKREVIQRFVNQEKVIENTKKVVDDLKEVKKVSYKRLSLLEFTNLLKDIKNGIVTKFKQNRLKDVNPFEIKELPTGFYVNMRKILTYTAPTFTNQIRNNIISFTKLKGYYFKETSGQYEGVFEFVDDVLPKYNSKDDVLPKDNILQKYLDYAKDKNINPKNMNTLLSFMMEAGVAVGEKEQKYIKDWIYYDILKEYLIYAQQNYYDTKDEKTLPMFKLSKMMGAKGTITLLTEYEEEYLKDWRNDFYRRNTTKNNDIENNKTKLKNLIKELKSLKIKK